MTPDMKRALGVVYALGDKAPRISEVRALLGLPVGDVFDERLSWFVKGVQARAGLPVSGWLTQRTLDVIDRMKGVDRGVAESAVAVTVAAVGTVAAGAPMVVLAVSEEAARNAQFAAAIIAAILGFGAILGWFARKMMQGIRKLEALDDLTAEVRALAARAEAIGARQVTLDRYEADRAEDQRRAAEIFAAAEANRETAERQGMTGLVRLPYKPD